MPQVILSKLQIDTLADACSVAVNESVQFLDSDVRSALADALDAMNKPLEAVSIRPDGQSIDSDQQH